jgi:hypothetical protein
MVWYTMHKTVKSDILFIISIVAISLTGLNLGIIQKIKHIYVSYIYEITSQYWVLF